MKRVLLLLALSLVTVMSMAQTRRVSGKVISAEDSSPVPGAGVIVNGTTMGTVTGADGTFSLNVPADAKSLIVDGEAEPYTMNGNDLILVEGTTSMKALPDT